MVWYGMVNLAIITKVSNELNTLVSGEKPGFQTLSKGLVVLLCAEVVRQRVPCTANARRPTVDSRCRGTTVSCCVADLRRCLPTTSVTGVQQSTRYCGALPCRYLCMSMMTPSLYVTQSATSSQCRSSCKIWVRPWSNLLVSLTTRAAAFITRCRMSVTDFVDPASTALQWSTREVTNAWTSVAADSESSDRRTRLSWRNQ